MVLLIAVVVVLAILSFTLPYLGGSHGGLTHLFPR